MDTSRHAGNASMETMAKDEAQEDLSTDARFRRALKASTSSTIDDHAYWKAISSLQRGAPEDVCALVAPLADDPDPRVRALVPDVLRYLGGREQPLLGETVRLLGKMLETESTASVTRSIALAFVDLQHPAAIDLLRPFVKHPDATVREALVHGILPVAPTAIAELVQLSADESDDVRNWATFGLGSQLGQTGDPDLVDTLEVRNALVARLDDRHAETRAEAVLGLAVRGDERAIAVIKEEIEQGTEWTHYVEAAELLADARLYPTLVNAARTGKAPTDLTAAIAACDPRRAK